MADSDDIERQIMMEMEKEIQRTQSGAGGASSAGTTAVPPPFEITPFSPPPTVVPKPSEDDDVQAAIEARLRRKQAERSSRLSASQSPDAPGLGFHSKNGSQHIPSASLDDYFTSGAPTGPPVTAMTSAWDSSAQQRNQQVAEEEERREAEEQARREAEAEARREAEAEAQRKAAEEQARREAEAEARRQAEAEAQRKAAEEQARREAEAEARRQAEAEAQRKAAEEQARRQAEAEAQRKAAEEQARREAEAEARRQAEAEAQRKAAEEQARRQAEAEAQRKAAEEQARREAEAEARRQTEAEARREAEEQARREAEEQARREAEEEARREAEELARRQDFEQSLEEIRRKARENVFREFAERSKKPAEGSPRSAPGLLSLSTSGASVPDRTKEAVAAPPTSETVGPQVPVPVPSKAMPGVQPADASESASSHSDSQSEGGSLEYEEEGDNVSDYSAQSANTLALIRNDNGILSRDPMPSSGLSSTVRKQDTPLSSYEDVLSAELRSRGVSDQSIRRTHVDVHRYNTIREPGKCLRPPSDPAIIVPPHVKVQLGFFSTKQTIVSLQQARKRTTKDRERPCESQDRSLSKLKCYFESEVLRDPTLTVDDEDFPHNAPSECLVTREDVIASQGAAVGKAVSAISYGDPIQVWERVRDGTVADQAADGEEKKKQSAAATCPWVSGYETRKPLSVMGTFTGGFLLCIEATKVGSQVTEIHGDGTDPLIIAAALYSITDTSKCKVSETFYFDSSLDVFFPQKDRKDLARDNKVVAFVPAEFRSTLYLVTRVFRPCSEDFENYIDLYIRTDRYKPVHVAPMKQESLLLAQMSDVLEEIGWNSVACFDGKDFVKDLKITSVYRRPTADAELYRLINDERARGVLKTVPVNFQFTVQDMTKYEVAFPSEHSTPLPEENESMVSLLNPDVPGARAVVYRYVPCCVPILNAGFFTTYNNVYYFRMTKMKVVYTGALRNFPASHHTYAVQICVKDRDDSLAAEDGALPCIYGRGLNSLTMDTLAWSSSVHASTEFPLSDEFKIQLPLNLTNKHHIFLTLYATHQKRTPPTAGQPRTFKVGYAAFPIMVNGAVQTPEKTQLKFVAFDQAAAAGAGGYLENFAKAPATALLNNGDPVLTVSSQTKTTVYASNRVVSSVFSQCPASLAEASKFDDVLAESGHLGELPNPGENPHRGVITLIAQLPLAEILAFYPFLSSYAFALIGSPSRSVGVGTRIHMLDVLLLITHRAHLYDTNVHTLKRRHGDTNVAALFTRTTAASVLYHFLSNDTLYEGAECKHKFRLYAGIAETWLSLLNALAPKPAQPAAKTGETPGGSSPPASPKASGQDAQAASTKEPGTPKTPAGKSTTTTTNVRNLEREMSDLSWFLFDSILRSVYIWADDNPQPSRKDIFHPSFYRVLGDLCVTVLTKLSTFDENTLVQHMASFLCGLMHHCDRGQVLTVVERVVTYFAEHNNSESEVHFLQCLLNDPDAFSLFLPSAEETEPRFLTKIVVNAFSTLFVHKNRDIRVNSVTVLYNFLCGLVNDAAVASRDLSAVAAQLFTLVRRLAPQWKAFVQMADKGDAPAALREKRQLAMIVLWTLYNTPRRHLFSWLQEEQDPKVVAGVMQMIADAQPFFRYSGGNGKSDKELSEEQAAQLRDWDARNATFVTAIGVEACHLMLQAIPNTLRTVKDEKWSPCVFPFFVMLESVMHLGNSTASLQMSAAVTFETLCVLLPEILSKKARMSNGTILLTFRLMSSCCQYVRSLSGSAFFLMSQSFFTWKHSLSKIKSLTANALVSVAESKARDLRLAGRFIEFQFDDLNDRAPKEQAQFTRPSVDYDSRYEDDSNAAGGDAQMRYAHDVPELYMSVQRNIPISRYLLEKDTDKLDEKPPLFSEEFASMTSTVLSLFDDVLRLQVDDSMKFKEAMIFAYFEVFRNFMRQNALKEALKWLYRLHDAHKANKDFAEAGMVLVFIASLCFRVTEVFYFLKGKDSKGARMPYGLFTRVLWQDYVRILPEVEKLVQADTVYAIVSELYVCPDDACFTMEGQINALKEAADFLDKAQYYEFSIQTTRIGELYLQAMNDYKRNAQTHTIMSTWCSAIADTKTRRNSRYFLLWARMEREEAPKSRKDQQSSADAGEESMVGEKPRGLPRGKPIHRVYKMPVTTTIAEFKTYATNYVVSLFPEESLVVPTDELTETQPALPEPDTKRRRVAAVHRSPNHCLVTVSEVQPYFNNSRRLPDDGYDKTMHIGHFENVTRVGLKENTTADKLDLMSHRMSISTFELDRAFPSVTSAIDVAAIHQVALDPYETVEQTLKARCDMISDAREDDTLVSCLREALSPMSLPPGVYMKEVIAKMNDHPEVISVVRDLGTLVRQKMQVCDKNDAMTRHPEDYALTLKAVTDIECHLIAMDSANESVDRDD